MDVPLDAAPRKDIRLELLSDIRRAPLNRLVNEAVHDYLDVQAALLENDLEATLQRVKAYRAADPDFEHAIARFAEAEAEHAAEDPSRAAPFAHVAPPNVWCAS